MHAATCIVLDNGGATCKIGLAGQEQPSLCVPASPTSRSTVCSGSGCACIALPGLGPSARVFPNATGKAKGDRTVYVGDQLLEERDLSSLALRRPLDRRAPASGTAVLRSRVCAPGSCMLSSLLVCRPGLLL